MQGDLHVHRRYFLDRLFFTEAILPQSMAFVIVEDVWRDQFCLMWLSADL
jgi:hypothetical protein